LLKKITIIIAILIKINLTRKKAHKVLIKKLGQIVVVNRVKLSNGKDRKIYNYLTHSTLDY